MSDTTKPQFSLAKKTLPTSLLECLLYIFSQNIAGLALVGGTALAGFYAGHRRSDDLDLFSKDEKNHRAAVLAVKTLIHKGVQFSEEFQTGQYYKTMCQWKGHSFTIDVVEDQNLFKVGQFEVMEHQICIANLETLLMTKAATLVSRCGEKDLYDLMWFFEHMKGLDLKNLIELGQKVDQGVNGEAMLLSIGGTTLREDACHFSLDPKIGAKKIYQKLLLLQKELILNLTSLLKTETAPPLKDLIKKIKKLSRKV